MIFHFTWNKIQNTYFGQQDPVFSASCWAFPLLLSVVEPQLLEGLKFFHASGPLLLIFPLSAILPVCFDYFQLILQISVEMSFPEKIPSLTFQSKSFCFIHGLFPGICSLPLLITFSKAFQCASHLPLTL